MIRNGLPTIDNPDVADEVEYRRGYYEAAAIEEPTRTQIYWAWHRTSGAMFSRGFRAYVIGSAVPR